MKTPLTPKEKALQLCQTFGFAGMDDESTGRNTLELSLAKRCAEICADEILNIARESQDPDHISWWEEVKKEISLL